MSEGDEEPECEEEVVFTEGGHVPDHFRSAKSPGDRHPRKRSHVYLYLFVPRQKVPSSWTRNKQFVEYSE